MRRAFSNHIEEIASEYPELVFITGDLGFNAFENLQQKLGNRFINAGVAEQSMISMAAGMASQGHRVLVYSIAPFLVYRALEQIRNDICFHQMPVYLIGNGGGYGYGIMGSSHHALSDIATISSLPGINCYVPAFKDDVPNAIDRIFLENKPAYLRLGAGKIRPKKSNRFEDSERLLANPNSGLTIVGTGPVINNIFEHPEFEKIKSNIDIYSVNKFPINKLDQELELSLRKTQKVLVIEEHVAVGGLAAGLSQLILNDRIIIKAWKSRFALNYPNNIYGDQSFHQKQCGLDSITIFNDIVSLLKT